MNQMAVPRPKNSRSSSSSLSFRSALQKYIDHPEAAPKDIVIYYDDNYTVIRDLFPKAIIHWLILPRQNSFKLPQTAFTSTSFYDQTLNIVEMMQLRAQKELCTIMAKAVREQHNNNNNNNNGINSISDEIDNLIQNGNDNQLNDYISPLYIKAGCHAVPSLSNLHIHIISSDMNGANMKNKKHYNSFNTQFFIPFNEIKQLKHDDIHNDNQIMHNLVKESDMLCPWCKRNFTNKFTALRAHLQDEYNMYIKKKAEKKPRVDNL